MKINFNYIKGALDCKKGVQKASDNKDYLAGYSAQYQHEQMLSRGECNV